jgi:hypothetical protein
MAATVAATVTKVETYDPSLRDCPEVGDDLVGLAGFRGDESLEPTAVPHTCVELSQSDPPRSFALTLALPFAVPLQPGDGVSLSYHDEPDKNGGVHRVTVRRGKTLVLFVGHGRSLAAIDVPREVHLDLGARIGSRSEKCGSVDAYDLEAEAGGDRASIPWGGSAPLGELRIFHGGVTVANDENVRCHDWAPGRATVVVLGRQQARGGER